MNPYLQSIKDLIDTFNFPEDADREALKKALETADRQWKITEFKLDRTEKVKNTTGILLEETIEELEQKRKVAEESNDALQKSLEELKATQSQLVHSEKMASLGELTAGIAHEIQNPLNFVNNFSELCSELIEELVENLEKGDLEDSNEIVHDLKENLKKITHHGKRADAIVKSMLQHSRAGTGQKELTDLNALADEYLRLSYHGIRAKDKSFNSDFKTDFDPDLPNLSVVPQDLGRVILNLLNNAFYACFERKGSQDPLKSFSPMVKISTKQLGKMAEIRIKDNGMGIPDSIKSKIFQPFFTTKPTGQGTGLGLSLSYDIIKSHGGEISLSSEVGVGTEFIILLPIKA